jgi:hypothetical protein
VVLTALEEAEGGPVEAPRILGIHPEHLHHLIRNLDLKSGRKRLSWASNRAPAPWYSS